VTGRSGTPAYAGSSDVGRVRSGNEDSLLLAPPLFAVADGLGGHQAGEVASRIAVDTLLAQAPRRADAKALGRAARIANRAVIDAATDGRGRAGMGTTLTAVMVEGLRLAVAHVGDSRAYLLHRDGRLERITQDHSMVADLVRQGSLTEEDARTHPNRSVITRALGSDPNMAADAFEVQARPGDRLLLCTDGLSSLVPDTEIADILSRHGDPQEAVDALIAAARLAGGFDNITAVVVDLTESGGADPAERHENRWARRALWLLALLALVGVTAVGVYRYAASRAYLIAENDVVVVYRGVPGSVGGIALHWLDTVSDVKVADLPLPDQAALAKGVGADSIQQAYGLLAAYRVQAAKNGAPSSAPLTVTVPPTSSPPPTSPGVP
jgi:serine/threonine protein phosphatase PrpC